MRKPTIAVLLAAACCAAGASGAGSAAAAPALTVSITKNGFRPRTASLAFGASVTWRNRDSKDHQVVANDGSFASPVLKPGRTYSFTFARGGTFHYHDALHPRLTGWVKIAGPPPSLSLALDQPIVSFGTRVTLSGTAANVAPGTNVTLYGRQWGQPSPVALATVQTGGDGSFGYLTEPREYTTYTASFQAPGGIVQSDAVLVQVAPKVTLVPGKKGWMHAQVKAGKSMAGRHLFLQRLSSYGQWVSVAPLRLGRASGILFRPSSYLPKGASRIRVSLSVNQAGIGLLGSHSGTQTAYHR